MNCLCKEFEVKTAQESANSFTRSIAGLLHFRIRASIGSQLVGRSKTGDVPDLPEDHITRHRANTGNGSEGRIKLRKQFSHPAHHPATVPFPPCGENCTLVEFLRLRPRLAAGPKKDGGCGAAGPPPWRCLPAVRED